MGGERGGEGGEDNEEEEEDEENEDKKIQPETHILHLPSEDRDG